ncbi:hypothetical protein KI387_027659, partial [Taxus chinensis]
DIKGNDVDLRDYKGKVLLIVNVASQCGFTNSNYGALTKLYNKYKDKDFEILAFPCNQFLSQEPGTNEQIKDFACTTYKAEFPIFGKVDVNGPNTVPVYTFLKSSKSGFMGPRIKWNFTKFLVDKDGHVIDRYSPMTNPLAIELCVEGSTRVSRLGARTIAINVSWGNWREARKCLGASNNQIMVIAEDVKLCKLRNEGSIDPAWKFESTLRRPQCWKETEAELTHQHGQQAQ